MINLELINKQIEELKTLKMEIINSDKKFLSSISYLVTLNNGEQIIREELLKLGVDMQKETLATLISCYQVMLPKALKAQYGSVVNIKYDTLYRLNNNYKDFYNEDKLNDTQKSIIKLLEEKELVLKKELDSISNSSVKTLLKKNVILEEKNEHYRLKYNN